MMVKKKENVDLTKELSNVLEMMDSMMDDRSVPRNIKAAVERAKNKILKTEEEVSLRISSAIYELDDISNDINMPSHGRTMIWEIISELEFVKEKVK